MDNPITKIEEELKAQLLTILSTNSLPSGYTYYNDITVVNIEDEAIILDRGDYPSINIYLQPRIYPRRSGSDCTEYTLEFVLKCKVAIDDDIADTPQFEINSKLNDLLIDIEACIYSDRTINCSADTCDIIDARRVNTTNGDRFREANLEITLEIKYSSLDNNPTIRRR